jgi:integrase
MKNDEGARQAPGEQKDVHCCFVISRSPVRVRKAASVGGVPDVTECPQRPAGVRPEEPPRAGSKPHTCAKTGSVDLPVASWLTGGMPPFAHVVASYLQEITPTKAPTTRRQDDLYARLLIGERDLDGTIITPGVVLATGQRLAEFPIALLGVPEAHAAHVSMRETPTLANRVLSFISQTCALAERLGLRAGDSNPTKAIRRFRERIATNFLTAPQRRAFVDACWCASQRGEVTCGAACVCLLLLLAGLRLHEATDLRWSEVDLHAGVIRLLPREERPSQTNKTSEGIARPITDDVIAIISTMPRWCEWVCPNPRTRAPYVDVRKPMARICEIAALPPKTTRHALRHSFGTALGEAGYTAEQIGPWLGDSAIAAARYINLTHTAARRDQERVGRAVRGTA